MENRGSAVFAWCDHVALSVLDWRFYGLSSSYRILDRGAVSR